MRLNFSDDVVLKKIRAKTCEYFDTTFVAQFRAFAGCLAPPTPAFLPTPVLIVLSSSSFIILSPHSNTRASRPRKRLPSPPGQTTEVLDRPLVMA
jgi:hypothetical protein